MPPCPPGPLSQHSSIVLTKHCLVGPQGPSWVLWGQSGTTASLSGFLSSSQDPLGKFSSTEHSHPSSDAFRGFFVLFLTSSMFPDAANVSALSSGLSSSTRSLPGEHFRLFCFKCLLMHSDVLHSFVDRFQSSSSRPYTWRCPSRLW